MGWSDIAVLPEQSHTPFTGVGAVMAKPLWAEPALSSCSVTASQPAVMRIREQNHVLFHTSLRRVT